jgi:hypothetical protein
MYLFKIKKKKGTKIESRKKGRENQNKSKLFIFGHCFDFELILCVLDETPFVVQSLVLVIKLGAKSFHGLLHFMTKSVMITIKK